ncbi:hypothetical protein BGX30_002499, partial [Mortierella sp. GBA39]
MTVKSPSDLPTQAVTTSYLKVSWKGHRKGQSSTASVNIVSLESGEVVDKGYNSDSGFFSTLLRKARQFGNSKSKKSIHMSPSGSAMSITTPDIVITPELTGAPSFQTSQPHPANGPHAPFHRGLDSPHPTDNGPSPLSMASKLRHNIFLKNTPTPTVRSALSANPRARFESTLQLAFCASMLPNDTLSSTPQMDAVDISHLDDAGRQWWNAIKDDLPAQSHIRWLIAKMVAEFIKDPSMVSTAISEVVVLGPVLCREDFRALLSCFLVKFNERDLLDVELLQGMVQLVQSASPGFLADDDLVQVLGSLRKHLQETHVPTKNHVYQIVLAISKVLEVMVHGGIEGLDRQRNHQPLLTALRALKGVDDDALLKFQVKYAYQTLLYLPDDETSWQAFLRYAESFAVGVSAVASVFKLDPKNALDAIEHLQQVAGNAVDVVKSNIDGIRAFQAAVGGAAQTAEKNYCSGSKQAWFLTLQVAQAFARDGRLIEFNQLVCDAACRSNPNFQRGVCQILGEMAFSSLWDITSRRSAVDFLGELYKVDTGRKKDTGIQQWIVSILTQISSVPLHVVSTHARILLDELQREQAVVDTGACHSLHTLLPLPTSFPLLRRALDMPFIDYDLESMRLQQFDEPLFPISIPLHTKSNASHTESLPLMKMVLDFVESERRVFLVLGDSGSGKSTFCRQLERKLWNRHKNGGRIPLFINLSSIHQPDIDLIEKHLGRHHHISDSVIQDIKRHRRLVLICDGYDESRLTTNLYTTNHLSHLDVKVVITCRNTFLHRDYQGRFLPHGHDRYNDRASDRFEEATIAPFSRVDIKEFIKQYVQDPATQEHLSKVTLSSHIDYWEKLSVVPDIMSLIKNPFLLTLALQALPSLPIDTRDPTKLKVLQNDLYDGFIQEWIETNKKRLYQAILAEEFCTERDILLNDGFARCVKDYSKRLADAIYRCQDGHPVVRFSGEHHEDWKREFFGPEIKTTLLREASPLTRAGIRHWFIHKSLLDYFYARSFYDPDDSDDEDDDFDGDDDDFDGDDDDFDGDDDDSCGSGGNSVGDTADSLNDNNDGSTGGGGEQTGGNGDSTDTFSGTTGGGGDSAVGNGNLAGSSGGSSGGNHGASGNGDSFHGGNDDFNRDKDDSRRGKGVLSSKRKHKSGKSRPSPSSDPFSKRNLFTEPSVLQFLVERAQTDHRLKMRLFSSIEQAKALTTPSLAAANAITLLYKAGERLCNIDMSGVQVPSDYILEEALEFIETELLDMLSSLIPPVRLQLPAPPEQTMYNSDVASFMRDATGKRCSPQRFAHLPGDVVEVVKAVIVGSTALPRQLIKQNTTVLQSTTALPIDKDKFHQSSTHFENYVEVMENGQKEQADRLQSSFQQGFSKLEKEFARYAETLKSNSILTTLNLQYNSIGENGAVALSEALKTNSTLTTLGL